MSTTWGAVRPTATNPRYATVFRNEINDDRRAALTRAAVRVIARGGVAAVTPRAVTVEARMPIFAYRQEFSSQEELLSHVVQSVTDSQRTAADSVMPYGGVADLHDVVVAALDSYVSVLVSHPERELALVELAVYGSRYDPALVDRQYAYYYREAEGLLDRLAHACGCQWREPREVLARRMVTVMEGIRTTWLADRNTAAAREFVRSVAPWLASAGVRQYA